MRFKNANDIMKIKRECLSECLGGSQITCKLTASEFHGRANAALKELWCHVQEEPLLLFQLDGCI